MQLNFGKTIDERISQEVLTAFAILKKAVLPGVLDIVPAYVSLAIHFDPLKKIDAGKLAFDCFAELVIQLLDAADHLITATPRHLNVPVCYSPGFGLDLETIAQHTRLTVEELIEIHCSTLYRVYMVGFLPGFAYMGNVDSRIAMARHAQPRMNVSAGSVGIAERQTGIYPLDSPGGWQIIGRTPVKTFDGDLAEPVYFQPGDHVSFYSITEDEFENY